MILHIVPLLCVVFFDVLLQVVASLPDDSSTRFELACPNQESMTSNESKNSSIRVAHLGNSIQYYNDCPRLLEHLLRMKYDQVTQDSCLRGGASLVSLSRKGNGMARKFQTPPAKRPNGTYDIGSPSVESLLSQKWDFVIFNDHTQAPARADVRAKSIRMLQSFYLPLLSDSDGTLSTTVIFLMTAAYRKPVNDSDEIGTYDTFTSRLREGYAENQSHIPGSKVAPVGLAYQYLHQRYPNVWEGLYARDDFHPSPHGTLLEAYVLFATITETCPPFEYSPDWWRAARYMQPPEDDPLPLPSLEEANFLREVACHICGVSMDET
jgi:hypothetical protein